ncbi:MAG TPA: hypothetical protein VFG10_05415 [Saprospiraceae bacterium]|nr:hypothetical protein [Saprospiraceae bacterium]
MKVRARYNTGEDLKDYEIKSLRKEEFGRFGASVFSIYGEIENGKEYLVMGMIMFESYLGYLIDDNGFISTCPCYLFEIVDNKITPNWHFRLVGKEEETYPFVQAIWSYYELCFDKRAYESLIIEKTEESHQIYFKRKFEMSS